MQRDVFFYAWGKAWAELLPIPPACKGRRLNPLFCPTCILPGCQDNNRERPNVKAESVAATYRGDQQNGKQDLRDETPAIFWCNEFLDSKLAMEHTTFPRKLSGTSESHGCLGPPTSNAPLHPTPGWDLPSSWYRNKIKCSQSYPPGCFISHLVLNQIESIQVEKLWMNLLLNSTFYTVINPSWDPTTLRC